MEHHRIFDVIFNPHLALTCDMRRDATFVMCLKHSSKSEVVLIVNMLLLTFGVLM